MAADGSNPRLLRSGCVPAVVAGRGLAGRPARSRRSSEVAIVGADGAGVPGPCARVRPRVVADGRPHRLSRSSMGTGRRSAPSTCVVGRGRDPGTPRPAGSEVAAPAWLAEAAVAFVQDGNVWMLRSGAGAPVAITTGMRSRARPAGDPLAVSPDGGWIAFTHGHRGRRRRGASRPIDGGNRAMPSTVAGPVTQPAWAPTSVPSPGRRHAHRPHRRHRAEPVGRTWTAGARSARGRWIVPVGRHRGRDGRWPRASSPSVAGACRARPADLRGASSGPPRTGRAWERAPASDATDTGAYFPTSGPEIGMFDVAAGGAGIVAIGYAARPDHGRRRPGSRRDGASWERSHARRRRLQRG